MNISARAVNPGQSGYVTKDPSRNAEIFPLQKHLPGSEKRAVNRRFEHENIPSAAESPGSFLASEVAANSAANAIGA